MDRKHALPNFLAVVDIAPAEEASEMEIDLPWAHGPAQSGGRSVPALRTCFLGSF